MQRYAVPYAAFAHDFPDIVVFRTEIELPIRIRVCNLLKQWVEGHFQSDFNEKLIASLNTYAYLMFLSHSLSVLLMERL